MCLKTTFKNNTAICSVTLLLLLLQNITKDLGKKEQKYLNILGLKRRKKKRKRKRASLADAGNQYRN